MITSFVPGFASIIDQERPVRILTTLLRRGNIPHALLFTGIDGVGKKEAAVALAMASNCQVVGAVEPRPDRPSDTGGHRSPVADPAKTPGGCGTCKACRKILSGNHPDLLWIKPTGAAIKIGQIRELAQRVALKPYEANCRVVIVAEADKMNAAASNALLKMLEEPPAGNLFILTAPQPGDLLPTVASRCQHIRFGPLSRVALQRSLSTRPDVAESETELIAALAGGSASRAEQMVQTNWLMMRNWLIDQMMTLSLKRINHLLALAEFLAGDRNRLQDSLEIMQTWLRDLLVHPYDPAKMLNADLESLVPPTRAGWDPDDIIAKMEAIENARKSIEANTNARLACEALLFRIVGEPDQTAGSLQ